MNREPITAVTSFYDSIAPINSRYFVKALVNNTEVVNNQPARILNNLQGKNGAYFDIPINKPGTGTFGGNYSPNDASTGDLNGDGEYDIVLKWDPNNSKDNSQSGNTDNVYLDGYTLAGEQLWRIDLGQNIRAGAHYTQFLVYDFDGNGKAEIMVKTAPGTKDASGNYISKGPAKNTNHTKSYRNSYGYILSGPEYLTVFDGETGLELATADYWPERGTVSSWGDDYGNRLDRYNATVAYVDGKRPSAVFQRGYYTRLTMAAWNWRNGELTKIWMFDSKNTENKAYFGQGNHSIHVIDANNDGLQDIVTGAAVISGTGVGLHTSGKGHGDACHVTYMKKDDKRPMIFMPHESGNNGVMLRYADNGEVLFQVKKSGDIGRGCTAELDPNVPGFHYWASSSMGLYDINGKTVGSVPNSTNFVIWWDGKLSRDLMNGNHIDQWSIKYNSATRLLTGDDTNSNNSTKSTPTLQADLFGDWREEVILRHINGQYLRVFTSTMPTAYKLYTFMHDPVYRVAVSWQNSSYNQPPHPGYYVASDMDFPTPRPNVTPISGFYRGTGKIIKNLMINDLNYAQNWQIIDSLSNEKSIYTNKTMFASNLPEFVNGCEWISTPTVSNQHYEKDTLASFTVTTDATIYVFYAHDASTVPKWLTSFNAKDETITVSTPISEAKTLRLYEKTFVAGEKVILGSNSENGNTNLPMYFVVAKEIKKEPTAIKFLKNTNTSLKIYPNPFNLETTIEYFLDSDQIVNLSIYDINGKLIKTIENKKKFKGLNSTTIDGSTFANGLYLVQLVTPNFIKQQKLVRIEN